MRGRCQQRMPAGYFFSSQADRLRMKAAPEAKRQNKRFLWGFQAAWRGSAAFPRERLKEVKHERS